MKKFLEEFKAFALKGNVMDMAVGVIIGGAFTAIVTSLTDNFINPIINFILNIGMLFKGQLLYSWGDISGFVSNFLSSVVNFLILALILFFLLKGINKLLSIGKKKEAEAPKTKKCDFCKSEIDIEATRCPHCTAKLIVVGETKEADEQ
jgi:large conductance mechanosensitive channel